MTLMDVLKEVCRGVSEVPCRIFVNTLVSDVVYLDAIAEVAPTHGTEIDGLTSADRLIVGMRGVCDHGGHVRVSFEMVINECL
jgi:hypothetical protein